jgi:hypothetical protein
MTPLRQVASQAARPALIFTTQERRGLRLLRARYRQDHDLFTQRERAHLRFVHWLYQTGRLAS